MVDLKIPPLPEVELAFEPDLGIAVIEGAGIYELEERPLIGP